MINALVIVQAVESSENFVAQDANGTIEWLEMLLLFVPLERELGRQFFPAHVAGVENERRREVRVQRVRQMHRQNRRRRACREDMTEIEDVVIIPLRTNKRRRRRVPQHKSVREGRVEVHTEQ